MPKDATKNIDRYKIRGGQLNEFDLHQNQEEYVKDKDKDLSGKQLIPAKATKQLIPTKATKASSTKAGKATRSTKENKAAPMRGATAKKLAAQKAAKKK